MKEAAVSFPATVARTSGGPVSGTLSFVRDGLYVEGSAGESFSLPFAELELELGGFEKDFVFCRVASLPKTTVSVKAAGFLAELHARAGVELNSQLDNVRQRQTAARRGVWWSLLFVMLLLGAAVLAVVMVPRVIASSVEHLPRSVDRQLGDLAMADAAKVGAPLHQPAAEAFLKEIVARLSAHAPVAGLEFDVRLVDDPQVNAFALPGGHITVFRGLLEKASEPSQVAGVIAHEMAHVIERHGLRNVVHSLGVFVALQLVLGDAQGWLGLSGQVAASAVQNDYSRDQETAADAEGVRLLIAAGIDPAGLAGFFELLQKESGSELPGLMNWMSTHPEHRARIEHVKALAARSSATRFTPLQSDWEAVKRAFPGAAAPPP